MKSNEGSQGGEGHTFDGGTRGDVLPGIGKGNSGSQAPENRHGIKNKFIGGNKGKGWKMKKLCLVDPAGRCGFSSLGPVSRGSRKALAKSQTSRQQNCFVHIKYRFTN